MPNIDSPRFKLYDLLDTPLVIPNYIADATPDHISKTIFEEVIAATKESIIAIVITIAVRVFLKPCFPALLGVSAGLLATRIFVRLTDKIYPHKLDDIKRAAYKIRRSFPKIQIITLIFSVTIGFFVPLGGGLLGGTLGVLGGITASHIIDV